MYSESEVEMEDIPKFQILESFGREQLHEHLKNLNKKSTSKNLSSRLKKSKLEPEEESEKSEEEPDIREWFYFSSKLYKFILQNAKRIKKLRLFMRLKREDIDKGFHKLNSYTKKKLRATEHAENLLLENPLGVKREKIINILPSEEEENDNKIYQISKKR